MGGLGLRVWGLGFRVWGLGFGVYCRAWGLGFWGAPRVSRSSSLLEVWPANKTYARTQRRP